MILDFLSDIGFQVAILAIVLTTFLIPAYVVDRVSTRFGKPRNLEQGQEGGLGCATQAAIYVAAFFVIGLALWPAKEALEVANCKQSDDFELCMDIDGSDLEYDRR